MNFGSESVIQGQAFYRIKKLANNSGDIFPVNISAKAIVVGPESDFAEYTIYYFDPVKNSRVSVATLSSDQPFIGRLGVDLSDSYPSSAIGSLPPIPGQLFIAPRDLYNSAYFTATGIVNAYRPRIDLLVYTKDVPVVPDKRPTYRVRTAMQGSAAVVNVAAFPVYGRRALSMRAISTDGAVRNFTLRGLKFTLPIRTDPPGSAAAIVETLAAGATSGSLNDYISASFNEDMLINDAVPGNFTGGFEIPVGRWDYVVVLSDAASDPSAAFNGQVSLLVEAYD